MPDPAQSTADQAATNSAATNSAATDSAATAREILRDSFERVRELVESITDGLSDEVGGFRPDAQANSIAWLLWHLTRVQDSHIADAAGTAQLWPDWSERFALPFPTSATGYGQSAEEVGQVRVPANLLAGYHAAVHDATLRYLDGLTAQELERVVDERWDPPVTVAARLVSVLGDTTQHAGQAAYVKGLAGRR